MIQKQMLMLTLAVILSLGFISGLSITDVDSFPQEIIPGENAEVSIEIENTLGENITNLNVKLILSEDKELGFPDLPFAPYQSGSEQVLDSLDDGDEETFEFDIIALPTAEAGIYKIPVILSYDIEGDNETVPKTEWISLIINSEPELKIFSEESILILGQESVVTFKIVNSGLSKIKFAYFTVASITGLEFLSEREQYMGDIDSDDFDSVEYIVYVETDTPSSIKIPITIKYKDATNKEFEETREITFKVYSLQEAQERGFIPTPKYGLFLGIAGVVILFFAYRFWKKRKLKKKK